MARDPDYTGMLHMYIYTS